MHSGLADLFLVSSLLSVCMHVHFYSLDTLTYALFSLSAISLASSSRFFSAFTCSDVTADILEAIFKETQAHG